MEIDETCVAYNGIERNAPHAVTQPGTGTARSRQLLELIGLIADAALDPAVWPEALSRLAEATGTRIVALPDDGGATMPRLHRPWRSGDFAEDEVDLSAALAPHIRRAVQLQHRLAALELQRASSAAAFDQLRDGVIIVDDQSGIVFANRSADDILAEGDGLIRDGSAIAAATPAGTATLRRLVAAAPGNGPPEPGSRCMLDRRDGRSPLSVLVVPLYAEVAWGMPRRPAAVLLVSDPDRDGRASIETLRRRFNLTPAEATFLAEIVKGDGIQAAADRVGVSLATARTHLRHVFDKTGTQRQAELVGLVMTGAAMRFEDA